MDKKYKMDKEKREEEIDSRIIRDNPKPILMGNGVHREEKNEAQKIDNDNTLKRAKKELDDDKGAMKPGKMERPDKDIVSEN